MARYTLKSGQTMPPTPFYYYDMDLLRRTLGTALTEAARYGYHIHYALKANAEPHILRAISGAGMGADAVSGYEVKQAIENGFDPQKIVFAGVGKSDHEIEYAISQDIFIFNCESLQELEVVNEIATRLGKTARIAFRINPDVKPETHKYISTGHSESKFGISYEEIDEALAKVDELDHLRIVGIHFHIGSQIGNMDAFEQLAQRANEISRWFSSKGIELEVLNMGGGLRIDYEDPDGHPIPDFASYFRIFHENLQVGPGQTVHFELGRAIVAQCGELITKVLYTKKTAGGAQFAITDAGMTELIRPALYQAHHRIQNLTAEAEHDRPMERYYIGGPICESSDIFAHDIEFPHSERGDILTLRSTGAYGSIMASNYNLRPFAPSHFSEE